MRKLMLIALLALVFLIKPEAEANARVSAVIERVDRFEILGAESERSMCGRGTYVEAISYWHYNPLYIYLAFSFTTTDDAPDLGPTHPDAPTLIAFDGLGNNIAETSFIIQANVLNNWDEQRPLRFSLNTTYERPIIIRPLTISFYDNLSQSIIEQVTFDPADYDPSCASMPYVNNVAINDVSSVTQDASVYVSTDDEGNESLDIYGINDEGEGYLLFDITQADFAPFVDNPPAQNTELESVDDVTLYILTTGEYQLNIGPDEEGKVRVIVFEGLPPTNVYSYDFNVYDILDE